VFAFAVDIDERKTRRADRKRERGEDKKFNR